MIGLKYVEKIREYCDYIEEHLNNVEWAWKVLQDRCSDMEFIWNEFRYLALDGEILCHDISKFSKEEFIPYCMKFYPPDLSEFSSIIAIEDTFPEAWLHHQLYNPHHWENWTKGDMIKTPYDKEMHCIHMIIDWMAMSKKFNNNPRDYYERNKDKMNLPDWANELCLEVFYRIDDLFGK